MAKSSLYESFTNNSWMNAKKRKSNLREGKYDITGNTKDPSHYVIEIEKEGEDDALQSGMKLFLTMRGQTGYSLIFQSQTSRYEGDPFPGVINTEKGLNKLISELTAMKENFKGQ